MSGIWGYEPPQYYAQIGSVFTLYSVLISNQLCRSGFNFCWLCSVQHQAASAFEIEALKVVDGPQATTATQFLGY
jgi:hypothetical protein